MVKNTINHRIEEIVEDVDLQITASSLAVPYSQRDRDKKFADMIINECLQVLRNEWYKENNKVISDRDPRTVGIHVGHKGALITAQYAIRSHFGIKDD